MTQRDHYEVLGASRNSSQEEIRAKFRRLALEYHPDRNEDPKALEKFKDINAAYQVLSDPQKRAQYDSFSHAGARVSDEYCPNGNHLGQGPFCTRCGQPVATGSNTNPSTKQKRIDAQWYAVMPSDWGPPGRDSRIHNFRERRRLYDILDQDETIKALVEGDYQTKQNTDPLEMHTVAAVATDRRIIFLDKGLFGFLTDKRGNRFSRPDYPSEEKTREFFGSQKAYEMPLSSIEDITHHTGIMSGAVQIAGLGVVDLRINNVLPKKSAKLFADNVWLQIQDQAKATPQATQNPHTPTTATYVADELEKLSRLVKEGFLTREEFEAKKKQLLGL